VGIFTKKIVITPDYSVRCAPGVWRSRFGDATNRLLPSPKVRFGVPTVCAVHRYYRPWQQLQQYKYLGTMHLGLTDWTCLVCD